jgi:hypothetical protein
MMWDHDHQKALWERMKPFSPFLEIGCVAHKFQTMDLGSYLFCQWLTCVNLAMHLVCVLTVGIRIMVDFCFISQPSNGSRLCHDKLNLL